MDLTALLSDAVASEDGRNRAKYLSQECKRPAEAAVFLGLALHKLSEDASISLAFLCSESPIEEQVQQHIHAAWAELNEARAFISNHHIAAIKESRRD